MRYLFTLFLLLPATLMAAEKEPEPYCKRLPFDEEVPAGLIGKYEIIGKSGESGQPYLGELLISIEDNAYVLRRTLGGKSVQGTAWVEGCSPDKFRVLVAQYQPGSQATTWSCYLRYDGDNYTRATCKSFNGKGLEAWYQSHDPAP